MADPGGPRAREAEQDARASGEALGTWLRRLLTSELELRPPERDDEAEDVRLLQQPHVLVLEDAHPIGYAELHRQGGLVELRTVVVDPVRRGEGWSHEILVEAWSRWMQDPILNGVGMPEMPAGHGAEPALATGETAEEADAAGPTPVRPSTGARPAIPLPEGVVIEPTSQEETEAQLDLLAADEAASRSTAAETGAEHLRHQLGRRAEGRDLIAFTRSPALGAALHASGFHLQERRRRWWWLWLRRSLLGPLSTRDALAVSAAHGRLALRILLRGEPLPPRTIRRAYPVRWLQRRRRLFHQLGSLWHQRLFILTRARALSRAPPRRRFDPRQQDRSLAAHMRSMGMVMVDTDSIASHDVSATEAELEAWDLQGWVDPAVDEDELPTDPIEDDGTPFVDLTRTEPPEATGDDE